LLWLILADMESTPADSRKSSRRRRTKNGKKLEGSSANHASSSSASSSLASSRVSTPSLATNTSTSSGLVPTNSSSSTSATSESRQKFQYDRVSAFNATFWLLTFFPVASLCCYEYWIWIHKSKGVQNLNALLWRLEISCLSIENILFSWPNLSVYLITYCSGKCK